MLAGIFGSDDLSFPISRDGSSSSSSESHQIPRPPNPRKENYGLVGLLNQGTTCYLNSLLQTLFLCHEFRSAIYALSDEELGVEALKQSESLQKETEGERGEKEERNEENEGAGTYHPVDFQDDLLYKALVEFFTETGFEPSHVDLAIHANSCNLSDRESLMMWLLDNPLPENWEEAQRLSEELTNTGPKRQPQVLPAKDKRRATFRRIPIQMRHLFAEMQLADRSALSTHPLTKSFGWKDNQVGVQQDITELNRVLMDAIHRSLQGTSGASLVLDLFRGVFANKIVCLGCGAVRAREEYYQDVVLKVQGMSSIYDSLKSYVMPTELFGDNKYECEVCHLQGRGRQDALMGVSFRQLPKVMTFCLSRFDYDWNKNKRTKVNSRFDFPLVLDLEQFCEAEVDLRISQQQQQQQQQQERVLDDSNQCAHKSSKSNKKGGRLKKDGDVAQSNNLMEPSINPESKQIYDLLSVVVHTGGAHGGHYYAYIVDRLAEGSHPSSTDRPSWFEFNDSSVSPIIVEQIASQYGGRSHNAYMLVYVRREFDVRLSLPQVPPSLSHEISLANQELMKRREEYRIANGSIILHLSSLDRFSHVEGKLYKIDGPSSSFSPLLRASSKESIPTFSPSCDIDAAFQDLMNSPRSAEKKSFCDSSPPSRPRASNDKGYPETGTITVTVNKFFPISTIWKSVDDEVLRKFPAFSALGSFPSSQLRFDKLIFGEKSPRVCLSKELEKVSLADLHSDLLELTFEQAKIADRDHLLLWRGDEIQLDDRLKLTVWLYPESQLDLDLNEREHTDDHPHIPEPLMLEVDVRDASTVSELKHTISPLVKIAPQDLFVCLWSDEAIRILKNDLASLLELSISEGAVITAEKKRLSNHKNPHPISFALRARDALDNQIEVTVIDRTPPHPSFHAEMESDRSQSEEPETKILKINCSKENTVDELKKLIALGLIGSHLPDRVEEIIAIAQHQQPQPQRKSKQRNGPHPDQLVLRWGNIDGTAGAYIDNDSRTLLSHNISQNSTLIACLKGEDEGGGGRGRMSQSEEEVLPLRIHFVAFFDSESNEQRQAKAESLLDIEISSTSTLCDLKSQMINHLEQLLPGQFQHRLWRLRRINSFHELQSILQLENKRLDELEICDGDSLCLEEGRVPAPGELALYVQFFKYVAPEDSQPLLKVKRLQYIERQVSFFEELLQQDPDCLKAPTNKTVSRSEIFSSTLLDQRLQEERERLNMTLGFPEPLQIFSPSLYRYLQVPPFEAIPEMIFFSDFEIFHVPRTASLAALRSIVLKHFIQSDSTTPEIRASLLGFKENELTPRLRLWNGSRLLTMESSSLKKQNIANGSVLTAELLSQPDNSYGPSDTLLFIYLWLPVGRTTERRNHDDSAKALSSERPVEQAITLGQTATPDSAREVFCAGRFFRFGELLFRSSAGSLEDLESAVKQLIQAPLKSEPEMQLPSGERIQLAKFFPHQRQFTLLEPVMELGSADRKGQQQRKGKGNSSGAEMQDNSHQSPCSNTNTKRQLKASHKNNAAKFNLRKNACKLSHGDVLIAQVNVEGGESLADWLPLFLRDSRIPAKQIKSSQSWRGEENEKLDGDRWSSAVIYGPRSQSRSSNEESVEIDIGDIEGAEER